MIDYYIHDGEHLIGAGRCPKEVVALVERDLAPDQIVVWESAPYNMSLLGTDEYYSVTQNRVVSRELPNDTLWARIRHKRDALLSATDWRATRSVVEKRRLHPAWVEYRNALRDITVQPDPANIQWPAVPTAPTFADEDPNEYPVFEGNAKFEIFTDAERAAILSASQTDMHIMLLVNRLTGAAFVTYEDPEMELGLSLLVQTGLLSQERKDAIVQLMLPPALRG